MSDRTLADCIDNQQPISILSSASVLEAARMMAAEHCGSILVVSTAGNLTGIFTERDLLTKVVAKALEPATTKVADVMTAAPRTASPTMPVSHALILMRDGGFRHLPIVNERGSVLGIFSMRDTLTSELIDADSITRHQEHLGKML